ncbi:MAG: LysM peptidoglycan-binding domain-containing protein [Deltaproteobacteria bacterium]|nr:LysM peptidoglycan-binding domain-containing protein [Deltaproteobacteria bacterium]MBW2122472.1 LysM peptidoglycan-binding domain-containing protein [Deltaproteobacteria bacterium]
MRPDIPRTVRRIAAVTVFLLFQAVPCQAFVRHTIQKGESLAIVAKHYYGDPAKAFLLMKYNGINNPRRIKPGWTIVIPEVRTHRVRKGETLSLIAKKYLNDPGKSRGLAKLNGIKDPRNLTAGMNILLPVEIPHTVRRGESLSKIAQRYYGDTAAFDLIASYNRIGYPFTLRPGTHLILPIGDLRIVKRKSRAVNTPLPGSVAATNRAEAFLERGVKNYFTGDYSGAVRNLQKALESGLKGKQDVAKAYRFLAYAYVALDERTKAEDSFLEALKVNPHMKLDPVYVSPKIIQVFEKAAKRKKR